MRKLKKHRMFGYRYWFWRSGYFWEVGVTFNKNGHGFCIGVQYPPFQRISWREVYD